MPHPLVIPPCNTVFPEVFQRIVSGLAAMRSFFAALLAAYGVIDGSIYPLPGRDKPCLNTQQEVFYEESPYAGLDRP